MYSSGSECDISNEHSFDIEFIDLKSRIFNDARLSFKIFVSSDFIIFV